MLNKMSHTLDAKKTSEAKAFRQVHLNAQPNTKFVTNQVITARYSVLTWIPKSILIQFSIFKNQ